MQLLQECSTRWTEYLTKLLPYGSCWVNAISRYVTIAADPDAFLERAEASVKAAQLSKAKSLLQPMVEDRGWPWPLIEQLIDEAETIEQVDAIIADPDAFLQGAKERVAAERRKLRWRKLRALVPFYATHDPTATVSPAAHSRVSAEEKLIVSHVLRPAWAAMLA